MACKGIVGKHVKAILLRKKILLKRGWKGLLGSMIAIVVLAVLVIVVDVLFKSLGKTKIEQMSFRDLKRPDKGIAWIGSNNESDYLRGLLGEVFKNETGSVLTITDTENQSIFNQWLLSGSIDFINFGFGFDTANSTDHVHLTIYYNESRTEDLVFGEYAVTKLAWKSIFGDDADFTVSSTALNRRSMDRAFCAMAPLLISFAVLAITPIIISQPITDVTSPVRKFMMSCELTLPSYWLATFTVDFLIWICASMLMWIVFVISTISAFYDNLFNIWYSLVLSGPSFILFLYCLSFCFSNPQWAIGQVFLVLLILEILPLMSDIMATDLPAALEWFWGLFPPLYPQRLLSVMFMFTGNMKHSIGWYFTYGKSQPALLMQFIGILIWGFALWWIEIGRVALGRCLARLKFRSYRHIFADQKKLRPITDETIAMEADVLTNENYAIRVKEVSRLFFSASGDPITAVNNVSLGVEEGTVFGFLGANGAGKTTLIQMITSQLELSAGEIEIMGTPIDKMTEPLVAICPQFNNHLCMDLTPSEHFKLYSLLFSRDCEEKQIEELISLLGFEDTKDTPMYELSEGDCRKMAIALSFLGPAKIILLDEPTATLDSTSRLHVYELIQRHRGAKTFMLCTHLLGEAEALCDKISIMVKGSVYTVGTPQYLSSKFGTEFKIDVMLTDETKACSERCTNFMTANVPEATLSIQRPKTRIYNVPSHLITLPALFERMEAGITNPMNGISYYTCSSSSLERAFMEIVKLSEGGVDIAEVAEEKKELDISPDSDYSRKHRFSELTATIDV